MSPSKQSSQQQDSRRQLAVGIWSLLMLPMGLDVSEITVGESIWIVVVVSVASSFAYLLLNQNRANREARKGFKSQIPLAIAIAVPIGWTVLLASGSILASGFTVVVIGPISAVIALIMGNHQQSIMRNRVPLKEIRIGKVQKVEIPSACDFQVEPGTSGNPSIIRMSLECDDELETSLPEMESISPDVTQWLTRSKTVDGEIIEGGVRVEFAATQRDATVHLSFCPPFSQIPTVVVEDLDAADLEIRVSAVFCFGARLTVRRPKALNPSEESTSSRIGFAAVADSIRRVA